MKKIFKITLFTICLLPFKVFACTNSDLVKYREMAKNITYSYDYVEKNNNVSFSITLTNLTKNFVIYDNTKRKNIKVNSNEMTFSGYKAGTGNSFTISVPSEYFCTDSSLYSFNVNLPDYNPYYQDAICQGSNSPYCQKWIKMTLSYDEFKKEVLTKIETPVVTDIQVEERTFFDKIGDFYIKYYFIVLPGIILINCLIIYLSHKKKKL